jgi:hypothetical protein
MKLAQLLLAAMALSMVAVGGCKDKGSGGSVPTNQSSPKDLLESFHKCAEAKDMTSLVDLVDPAFQKPMRTMVEAMKTMETKVESLARTVESKIDKETADKIRAQKNQGQSGMKSPLEKVVQDGQIDWSKVKIEEKGDTATVAIDGRAEEVTLKKIGGKWYAGPPAGARGMTAEAMQAQADKMKGMMDKMGKDIDEVEKKVADGTIKKDTLYADYGKAMTGG